MKDCGPLRVRLFFAGFLVGASDPGTDPDAVLAFADLSALGPPCVIREDIHAGLYVGNALSSETFEYCGIVK